LTLLVLTRPGRPLALRCSIRHAGVHRALFAATLAAFGSAYTGLHAVYLDQKATANLARARLAAPLATRTQPQSVTQRNPG